MAGITLAAPFVGAVINRAPAAFCLFTDMAALLGLLLKSAELITNTVSQDLGGDLIFTIAPTQPDDRIFLITYLLLYWRNPNFRRINSENRYGLPKTL